MHVLFENIVIARFASSHFLGLWYPDGIDELARSNQSRVKMQLGMVTLVVLARLILVLYNSRSTSRVSP